MEVERQRAIKESDTLRWTEETLLNLRDSNERRRWFQLQDLSFDSTDDPRGSDSRGAWKALRGVWEERKAEWKKQEREAKEVKERIAESIEELKRIKQNLADRHCAIGDNDTHHSPALHASGSGGVGLREPEAELAVKGVLTWLGCRRDSSRWKEFIVSFQSVETHFNRRYRYPILIFHEGDYTVDTFEYLRSLSSGKVEFAQIDLNSIPKRC